MQEFSKETGSAWLDATGKIMRHAAWILGYHGCDRSLGEDILAGKNDLQTSSNDYDWLGAGAYFWENSYSRALDWANVLQRKKGLSSGQIKEPFVIGAIIDPGNCLDLSEDSSLRILKEAHASLQAIFDSSGKKMPENERGHSRDHDLVKRKLDCAVINSLHEMRNQGKQPPFDTIRCPFMEGDYLFKGSKFHAKTHLQWCVRNPRQHVWAYFRPRFE